MTLADMLRLLMRVAHTGALAVWLGGGLLFVLTRPQIRPSLSGEIWSSYSRTMRLLMSRSFALLVASGVYLVFDRIAQPRLGLLYVVVLAVKVALVVIAAWITGAGGVKQASASPSANPSVRVWWRDPAWQLVALGTLASVLGVLLTLIYEADAGRR